MPEFPFCVCLLLGLELPIWTPATGPFQSVCEDGVCGTKLTEILNVLAGAINFRFLEVELLKLTKSLSKHA